MGVIIDFPLRQDDYVKAYLKAMRESGRSDPVFNSLMDYVARVENALVQSNKNIADMQGQLSELKEIQKHPIKAELNNIVCAIQENAEAAKSWLEELKKRIAEWCKNLMAKVKEMGASALDTTVSALKIKDCLDGIAKCAAKENAMCGKAIKDMENFAGEYHKAGRAVKNMGRALIGKEPIDGVKENGKMLKIMTAPYRAHKSLAAKVERTAHRCATSLGDFHTQQQIKRLDRQDAKQANQAARRTPEGDFARMRAKQAAAEASRPQNSQKKPLRYATAGIEG
jgi:hypothetical protein